MDMPDNAIECLKAGRKIDAIKCVREKHGLGLKAAREEVERYIESQPGLRAQYKSAVSLPGLNTILVIICLLVISYYFLFDR